MRAYFTLALLLSLVPNAYAQQAETAKPRIVIENGIMTEGAEWAVAQERLSLSRSAFSRSVRDMATWDFGWLATNPNWVIAEITPPLTPTFWRVKELRPRTLVQIEATREPHEFGPEMVMVTEGMLEVLTPLGTPPQKTLWPYRYENTMHYETNGYFHSASDLTGTEARETYSPFHHGPVGSQVRNLALCSIPESIQNVETPNNARTLNPKYVRAHIISEETLKWVVPARTFYDANPNLFSSEKVAANRTRLVELLGHENPFLFAAAVRTLAQAGELDSSYISDKLLNADRFRQAVFVYSVLFYSPEAQGKVAVEQILQTIEKAQNNAPLEGLIIGADQAAQTWSNSLIVLGPLKNYGGTSLLEARPISPPLPPSLTLFQPLLNASRKKQNEFGVATPNEKYLARLTTRVVPPPHPISSLLVR